MMMGCTAAVSLFLDQLLHKSSDRYRPETILACTVAIDILEGEEPAVVHRGWGLTKDIKLGLKYAKEVNGAASKPSL